MAVLLTRRGLIALSAPLFYFVFATFGLISLPIAILLYAGTSIVIIAVAALNYRSLRALARTIQWKVDFPEQSQVMSEVQLRVRTSSLPTSSKIELRPELSHTTTPLVSHGSSQFDFTFTPLQKQVVQLSKLWFRLHQSGTLISYQGSVAISRSLKIYPAVNSCELIQSKAVANYGMTSRAFAGGEGREFDALQDYTAGDDLRRVDWKRSAHRNNLLVRTYRPETLQRVLILLDCSSRMETLSGGRRLFDHLVDSAYNLAALALGEGDQVGIETVGGGNPASLPATHGRKQLERVREFLFRAETGEEILPAWDTQRVCNTQRRRALVVLLTSVTLPLDVELIRSALTPALKRHLPLVVATKNDEITKLTEQPATSLSQAYLQAAAYHTVTAIQHRLETLRRSGIQTVVASPAVVGSVAGKQYLMLKSSGRI